MINRSHFNPVELSECDQIIDLNHRKIKLKQHQKTLLKKCSDIEKSQDMNEMFDVSDSSDTSVNMNTGIGILSDMPGSGKSYVILSLLYNTKDGSNNRLIHKHTTYAKNKIYLCKQIIEFYNTNVIVVPHNVFTQWQQYINDFEDFASIFICKMSHVDCFETELKNHEKYLDKIDIILVTVGFYNNLSFVLKKYNITINRLIIDEADNINVCMNNEIDNVFLWIITPSYRNLLHPYGSHSIIHKPNGDTITKYYTGIKKSGFVKNIFTSLVQLPNFCVQKLIAKNNDEFVKVSIELPDINYNVIKCKSPSYVTILDGIVNKKYMTSLNALDLRENHSQVVTNDNIIEKFIRSYTTEIQNSRIKIEYINKLHDTPEKEKNNMTSKIEEKILSLEEKISCIRSRICNSSQCYICYNEYRSKTILGCCLNSTCFTCIDKWYKLNNTCPVCKKMISKDNLFVIRNGDDDNDDYVYTKHENLKRILEKLYNTENKKVIIFSLSEHSLDNIALLLSWTSYHYSFLKGNMNTINNIINEFNSDNGKLRILLANPEFYGCGLNLEKTTDIIMFHKFDSDIENQVIGRAQRMGRDKPLNVWYLLHENEINSNA